VAGESARIGPIVTRGPVAIISIAQANPKVIGHKEEALPSSEDCHRCRNDIIANLFSNRLIVLPCLSPSGQIRKSTATQQNSLRKPAQTELLIFYVPMQVTFAQT
jgi:hypothetical protein